MLKLGALLTALIAVAAIAGTYIIFGNQPASAGADFIVTGQADSNDGVCDNDCSLREAIQNANTDPGPDVIAVPPGTYVLTIGGFDQAALTGDLDITSDITIQGSGLVTIDGNGGDHIFEILPGASLVTMTGLNLTNAFGDTDFGGAIRISTAASLQLQNCSITESQSTDGGGAIAVMAGGSLSMNNCTLDHNKVTSDALGGPGGNLYTSAGSVSTILNCTVSDGESILGAGAFVAAGGVMTASACSFLNNNASEDGGAVYNAGQAFLTNITTDQNHAGVRGGGTFTTGATAITNIRNSTLAFDTGESAEIHVLNGGTVNLHSTILRRTADPNCAGEPVNSQGYNLSLDTTCDLNGTGDIEGVDPLLGLLANNGGVTQTFLLSAGSQAINGGSPACPPPSTDQRGVNRPVGPRCDIGAVEMNGAAPTPVPSGNATNTPGPTNTQGPTSTPFGRDMLFGNNDCDNDIDTGDVLNLLLFLEGFDPAQDEPCPEVGDHVTIIE